MLSRILLSAALGAALLNSGAAHASKAYVQPAQQIGLVNRDGVALLSAPDRGSAVMATLIQQTQVVVLRRSGAWLHVSVWAGVRGWLPAADVTFRRPWVTVSTYRAPQLTTHPHATGEVGLRENAVATSALNLTTVPGGPTVGALRAGARVSVSGWAQDAVGAVWYRLGRHWARGDAIQFTWSSRFDSPIRRVSGKGMWLTLGPITGATPTVILDAARRAGITHLFLEAAISPLGFHGRKAVGPLIDAAHQRGIAVIAWVFPYLDDVASDVVLTRRVAAFRTPTGHGFDGIAADLETNVRRSTVRAYSQLVRAYLGPSALLVGVTYPPQSMPAFPFAEVAHDYDVIAPMDYWHETKTKTGPDYPQLAYSRAYGYRYALDSIRRIDAQAPGSRLAPIGQVFDNFGRLEMGPYAPSGPEVEGFMAGARAGGAIGVSFFQWMTATVDEWRTIRRFRY
jgi:hypothetical protein